MAEADPKAAAAQAATVATEGITAGNGTDSAKGNQTDTKTGEPAGGEGLTLEGFSEQERGELTRRFKSHNEIAKSYLELERKIGIPKERLLAIPTENASSEERAAFYKRLGRPESEAEYELETVFLPDGATAVDVGNAEFRKAALEAGLTKAQAKALHKYAATRAVAAIIQAQAEANRRLEEANRLLRAEYSTNLEAKKAQIPLSFSRFPGRENLIQFLNEGPGNDPRLVRYLIWVGEQFAPDNLNVRGAPAKSTEGQPERKPGQLDYSASSPELTEHRVK